MNPWRSLFSVVSLFVAVIDAGDVRHESCTRHPIELPDEL